MVEDEPDLAHRPGTRGFWGTWQSGLRYADGTPKPLYHAFRLPSRYRRGPGRGRALGPRAPRGGRRRAAHRRAPAVLPRGEEVWQEAGAVRVTDATGAFLARATRRGPGAWRFVWTEPTAPAPTPRGGLALLGPPPPATTPPTHASQALGVR